MLDAAGASGLTGTEAVLIGCAKALRRSDSRVMLSRVKTVHRVPTCARRRLRVATAGLDRSPFALRKGRTFRGAKGNDPSETGRSLLTTRTDVRARTAITAVRARTAITANPLRHSSRLDD